VANDLDNCPTDTPPAWVDQLADRIAASLATVLAERSAIVPLQVGRRDAATMTGVSPAKWDAMTAAGENPAPTYLGRIPYWRVEELKAWILAACPTRADWEAMTRRRRA
jgi:hypothetical protein